MAVGARTGPRRPIAYVCVHGTYHIILSRTHLDTLAHKTDRQTDRQTDKEGDSTQPLSLSLPLSRARALSLSCCLTDTDTDTDTLIHKHSHLDGIDNAENRVVVCVPQVDADRPT